MPRLSDSMEEGTILHWLISDGAEVQRGQELVEIETDKASMVYEADDAGVLHILASEGETVAVGAPIARLLAAGEQASAAGQQISTPADSAVNGSSGAEGKEQQPVSAAATTTLTGERSESPPTPQAASVAVGEPPTGARVKASPLARRRAQASGIDLASVSGSGPGGRILAADVDATSQPQSGARATDNGAGQAPSGVLGRGESQVVELTRVQSLIARRMAEATATIPEFTLQCEVDMEAAVLLRSDLKALGAFEERPTPSFNDMVVKACALALREFPRANGTYRDGRFELHGRVNVGIAVAAPDALVVPVIHDADGQSLWDIAATARALATGVRDGTITPPQLAGGTFSVSNLGMFGVDAFTAVINPPQAAILAVGSLAARAVVRDGELVARRTMTVTLSCDHRILYGADAAEFLARIRERLERPLTLLG